MDVLSKKVRLVKGYGYLVTDAIIQDTSEKMKWYTIVFKYKTFVTLALAGDGWTKDNGEYHRFTKKNKKIFTKKLAISWE